MAGSKYDAQPPACFEARPGVVVRKKAKPPECLAPPKWRGSDGRCNSCLVCSPEKFDPGGQIDCSKCGRKTLGREGDTCTRCGTGEVE